MFANIGAYISYNGDLDKLFIGANSGAGDVDGITIDRSTKNMGVGQSSPGFPLEVEREFGADSISVEGVIKTDSLQLGTAGVLTKQAAVNAVQLGASFNPSQDNAYSLGSSSYK